MKQKIENKRNLFLKNDVLSMDEFRPVVLEALLLGDKEPKVPKVPFMKTK